MMWHRKWGQQLNEVHFPQVLDQKNGVEKKNVIGGDGWELTQIRVPFW